MNGIHRLVSLLVLLLAPAGAAVAQQYEWRTPAATTFGIAVDSSLTFDSWRSRTVMIRGTQTWVWDGAAWNLRIAANPMGQRSNPGLAFDHGRGKAVLFAGTGLGGNVADTWEYDGDTWSRIATMTTPPWRWFGAMTYDSVRRRIYLVGGDAGGGAGLSDMWEYDGVDWTQLFPATMPTSRLRHAIAFDEARGAIVLFGGIDAAGQKIDETWEWNGVNWTKRTVTPRPPARMNHAMIYDAARARTVMFGGIDLPTSFDDTWEWDGATWTRVGAAQPAPPIATTHSMAYDRTRGQTVMQPHVLVTGGGDTWIRDGSGWQIAATAESPGVVDNHALAFDPVRGETVMFGQTNLGGTAPVETWLHRGGWWHRGTPTTTPAGRSDPALAFDWTTASMLMFGGATPSIVNETWLWNGNDWQRQFPANSPPPRDAAALASDSVRGRVVLFGGRFGATMLADTWEWNGSNWLRRTPATVPPGRPNAGMAFDPVRNVTVMFGGGDILFGPTFGDHWEWNGIDWTQRTPATLPAARAGHGLVFDADTQTIVALGGSYIIIQAFPIPHSDAWDWDGSRWTQRTVSGPVPLAHNLMRAAHDPTTRRTLTYGYGSFGLGGGTWLLGLRSTAAVTTYGSGCSGSAGVPSLRARGLPILGNLAFRVESSSLVAGSLALLAFGAQSANAPLPGGCDALVVPIRIVTTVADSHGLAAFPLPIPNAPILRGLDLFLQSASIDPLGAFASLAALSPGLRVRIDG
ncbi:MAG: hypothetical protein KDC98_12855 [Planctomycetes bacterium]|nr:hypothetical protein [Planctomycetota bacterium]